MTFMSDRAWGDMISRQRGAPSPSVIGGQPPPVNTLPPVNPLGASTPLPPPVNNLSPAATTAPPLGGTPEQQNMMRFLTSVNQSVGNQGLGATQDFLQAGQQPPATIPPATQPPPPAGATPEQWEQMKNRMDFLGSVNTSVNDQGFAPTLGYLDTVQRQAGAPASGGAGTPTGLGPAEDVLMAGLDTSMDSIIAGYEQQIADLTAGKDTGIDYLSGGRDLAVDALAGGKAGFDPFLAGGTDAADMRGDLLGVNGPEAQAAAFAAFKESPGQAFQQEQIEKALGRQAGRTGDFGGNFQKDLAKFTQGLTEQNFNTRLAQLGEDANRGMQAAQGLGSLAQSEAGIESDFGRNAALAELGTATQLAESAGASSVNVSKLITDASRLISEGKIDAGTKMAGYVKDSVSSLADLQQNQGIGISDILGAGGGAVMDIMTQSGLTAAQQQQILAAMMSDLATGNATNMADLEVGMGQAGALAELSKNEAMSGTVGKIFEALAGYDFGGGGSTISGSSGQMVA